MGSCDGNAISICLELIAAAIETFQHSFKNTILKQSPQWMLGCNRGIPFVHNTVQ